MKAAVELKDSIGWKHLTPSLTDIAFAVYRNSLVHGHELFKKACWYTESTFLGYLTICCLVAYYHHMMYFISNLLLKAIAIRPNVRGGTYVMIDTS